MDRRRGWRVVALAAGLVSCGPKVGTGGLGGTESGGTEASDSFSGSGHGGDTVGSTDGPVVTTTSPTTSSTTDATTTAASTTGASTTDGSTTGDPGCVDGCSGTPDTPVCDPALGECVPCTEHEQCSLSGACHLDGPQAGRCFDASEVVVPGNDTELLDIVAGIEDGDDVVIRIDYQEVDYLSLVFEADAEVALISPGYSGFEGREEEGLLRVGGDAIVYVDRFAIGDNLVGSGVVCSGGAVWLDRGEVYANGFGVRLSGGCQAHLRRMWVRLNRRTAIVAEGPSTHVEVVNSFVAGRSDTDVIDLVDASASIVYSSVSSFFESAPALRCTPSASAQIRNSILISESLEPEIDCTQLVLENSATESDFGGTNQSVGPVEPAWFAGFGNGELHLNAGHPFEAVAQWEPGDPTVDLDGDPRSPGDLPGGDAP